MFKITVFVTAMMFAVPVYAKSSAGTVGRPYSAAIWTLNDAVIRASLKCEIGRLAYDFGSSLPGKFSLAQVTIKLEKTNETVAGIDLKFPWFSSKGEFSRERTEVNGETVDIIYNISQVNAQKNCSKHNKFEIGVYNCLKGKLQLWKDAGAQTTGGGASCSSSVNVKRVASGNLGVKVWTIDLGPSASATEKGVYSFTVMVPPKP